LLQPLISHTSSQNYARPWQALALAWVAGFVDAFGFLALAHIFTSHVSGNSVNVGVLLAERHWAEALMHFWPILFFALGVFAGTVLEQAMQHYLSRPRLALILALEEALLVAYFFTRKNIPAMSDLPHGTPILSIGVLGSAMGVQCLSIRRVHGRSVNTPFVSGMLMQCVENFAIFLFDRWTMVPSKRTKSTAAHRREMLFYGSIWFAFFCGAASGGFSQIFMHDLALLVPVITVGLLIITDIWWPVHGS